MARSLVAIDHKAPGELRGSFRDEFRIAVMVCRRELTRFIRSRARGISAFVQPILFLFVMGFGLAPLVGTAGGIDFKVFLFPGIVAMTVITTAIFSAASIVWDREFGFLREMLVAPASRAAIMIGKTVGGATIATLQGTFMLLFAPLVGVRLTPVLVGQVMFAEMLMALGLTAFGIFVATRIQRLESFQVVMQLLVFPMIFLSGVMFPLANLPGWLAVLTRINPATYAVDPLRRLVFAAQDLPPEALERFPTGVELFGHSLSLGAEFAIVSVFTVVLIALSVRAFGREE